MFESIVCHAPRPDTRHAVTTVAGRRVDVDVTQDVVREGSYVVIEIGADGDGTQPQRAEYVTDYQAFDDAIGAGLALARSLIDEERGHPAH